MTYASQPASVDASVLSAGSKPDRAARPLPPGVGLAIGAAVSLGLWAGLAYAVISLVG
ncbi:hypothetical protein [Phenylobacterium sp.]|uniref:hypothetical protein n=1 Tax=Phenylobacterium sp. TaxID=1871053 RepID=UPI0025CBBE17|nr:hypothetical protein [Phenylobacterium sp.]